LKTGLVTQEDLPTDGWRRSFDEVIPGLREEWEEAKARRIYWADFT